MSDEGTKARRHEGVAIKPTVGRIVHYCGAGGSGPFAALIVWVIDDTHVNLAVFNGDGSIEQMTNVPYAESPESGTWCWMPYQLGHAAKTQELEQTLEVSELPKLTVEITDHHVGGACRVCRVFADSERGAGGARELYFLDWAECEGMTATVPLAFANRERFGVTNEALLAIVADRLAGFQAGPFACSENAEAHGYVHAALSALKRRTQDRIGRGVHGTGRP